MFENAAEIECPKCFRHVPINEIIEIETQPILSKISHIFHFLVYDRLICANCDNVRCVAASSDYWNCETCNCYICPLCAIERHSSHVLQYMYKPMLARWNKYDNKGLTARLEYLKIKQQRQVIHCIFRTSSKFSVIHLGVVGERKFNFTESVYSEK